MKAEKHGLARSHELNNAVDIKPGSLELRPVDEYVAMVFLDADRNEGKSVLLVKKLKIADIKGRVVTLAESVLLVFLR